MSSIGLELAPNVYYREDDLIERLGMSRAWLRRRVNGLKVGHGRVYRGADLLAAAKACPAAGTPSASTSTPAPRSGGPRRISRAKADASSDGQLASASTSPPADESLGDWLKRELKQRHAVEPISPKRQRRTRAQR
jgi:hypothetical protein